METLQKNTKSKCYFIEEKLNQCITLFIKKYMIHIKNVFTSKKNYIIFNYI